MSVSKVYTHLHGHKDTVSDPSNLFTKSYIVDSLGNVGIYSRTNLIYVNQQASAPVFSLRAPDKFPIDRLCGTSGG